MMQALQEQLYKRFPWIHSQAFYCGSGWFCILWDLCEEIEENCKKNEIEINVIRIDSITEKYGTLSFDVSNCSDEIYAIISTYEEKSGEICEECGESGGLNVKDEWLKTLCTKCSQEKGYKIIKNAGG